MLLLNLTRALTRNILDTHQLYFRTEHKSDPCVVMYYLVMRNTEWKGNEIKTKTASQHVNEIYVQREEDEEVLFHQCAFQFPPV